MKRPRIESLRFAAVFAPLRETVGLSRRVAKNARLRQWLIAPVIAAGFAAASTAQIQTPFVTPPAPVFTDAERHAELQRRRTAVEAKMAEGSLMILLSAEPKIYTNDVDYAFRQENNFYYLTNLKQKGSVLILGKKAG